MGYDNVKGVVVTNGLPYNSADLSVDSGEQNKLNDQLKDYFGTLTRLDEQIKHLEYQLNIQAGAIVKNLGINISGEGVLTTCQNMDVVLKGDITNKVQILSAISHDRQSLLLLDDIFKVRQRLAHLQNPANLPPNNPRYDLNGYKRIYLIHIRKTGGTSLNHMFLSLAGGDTSNVYEKICKSPNFQLTPDNLILSGFNSHITNSGNFFYAFSHAPVYKIELPPKTFTITCFRDPVKRVLSLYSMLMSLRMTDSIPDVK